MKEIHCKNGNLENGKQQVKDSLASYPMQEALVRKILPGIRKDINFLGIDMEVSKSYLSNTVVPLRA